MQVWLRTAAPGDMLVKVQPREGQGLTVSSRCGSQAWLHRDWEQRIASVHGGQFGVTMEPDERAMILTHECEMIITSVMPGGAVEAWNKQCAGESRKVCKGDAARFVRPF